ncbi:hypothetical protein SETIT_9G213900v2 [Setaria italica]|uniref:Uncharacterized protein n=1 Tax=Setaria italica TaxID=4555 RepID=K4AL08_SETIT|nr:hypothetical protein SETIT_9G213900v2 [Setaria italica]
MAHALPSCALTAAIAAVKSALKTFRIRAEKKLPGIVNYFGWCTWDTFYQDVSQEDVEAGLRSLIAAAQVRHRRRRLAVRRHTDQATTPTPTSPLAGMSRLACPGSSASRRTASSRTLMTRPSASKDGGARDEGGVRTQCPGRGPWHAITSYCGSVRPDAAHGRDGALLLKLAVSQGVTGCRGERARDDDRHAHPARARLRSPVYRFYDELHAYLATGSVDGIKVDVQSVLDTLGAGHGGRVQLTKQDHQALDASIAKNFQENLP